MKHITHESILKAIELIDNLDDNQFVEQLSVKEEQQPILLGYLMSAAEEYKNEMLEGLIMYYFCLIIEAFKNEGVEIGQVTEEPNEGNEFSGELAKAKAAGKDEFTVGGKRYKVKEGAKPDYLDLDKDGNRKEPMAKAVKDKEMKMKEQDLRRLAGLPISEVEETNQTTEAIDPVKAKLGQVIDKYFGQIYDYGDNGLEYLNRNGAFWTALYDKHDGDIDAIINNEDVMALRRAAQELKDIAGDLKYELSEADSYSIKNTETDNTYHISKYPITANHSIYKKIKTKDPQAQIYKNGQPVKEANECDNSMPMPQSPMHAQDSGVNISTNMNTKTGNKSITITADGEAAEQLAQMLKMAGMR